MKQSSLTTPDPVMQLDIRGAFVRRANLNNTNLERANLSRADAKNALFRGANFKDANLNGTDLRGADLTGATNLTIEQLRAAKIDGKTRLPDYINLMDIVDESVI